MAAMVAENNPPKGSQITSPTSVNDALHQGKWLLVQVNSPASVLHRVVEPDPKRW